MYLLQGDKLGGLVCPLISNLPSDKYARTSALLMKGPRVTLKLCRVVCPKSVLNLDHDTHRATYDRVRIASSQRNLLMDTSAV